MLSRFIPFGQKNDVMTQLCLEIFSFETQKCLHQKLHMQSFFLCGVWIWQLSICANDHKKDCLLMNCLPKTFFNFSIRCFVVMTLLLLQQGTMHDETQFENAFFLSLICECCCPVLTSQLDTSLPQAQRCRARAWCLDHHLKADFVRTWFQVCHFWPQLPTIKLHLPLQRLNATLQVQLDLLFEHLHMAVSHFFAMGNSAHSESADKHASLEPCWLFSAMEQPFTKCCVHELACQS